MSMRVDQGGATSQSTALKDLETTENKPKKTLKKPDANIFQKEIKQVVGIESNEAIKGKEETLKTANDMAQKLRDKNTTLYSLKDSAYKGLNNALAQSEKDVARTSKQYTEAEQKYKLNKKLADKLKEESKTTELTAYQQEALSKAATAANDALREMHIIRGKNAEGKKMTKEELKAEKKQHFKKASTDKTIKFDDKTLAHYQQINNENQKKVNDHQETAKKLMNNEERNIIKTNDAEIAKIREVKKGLNNEIKTMKEKLMDAAVNNDEVRQYMTNTRSIILNKAVEDFENDRGAREKSYFVKIKDAVGGHVGSTTEEETEKNLEKTVDALNKGEAGDEMLKDTLQKVSDYKASNASWDGYGTTAALILGTLATGGFLAPASTAAGATTLATGTKVAIGLETALGQYMQGGTNHYIQNLGSGAQTSSDQNYLGSEDMYKDTVLLGVNLATMQYAPNIIGAQNKFLNSTIGNTKAGKFVTGVIDGIGSKSPAANWCLSKAEGALVGYEIGFGTDSVGQIMTKGIDNYDVIEAHNAGKFTGTLSGIATPVKSRNFQTPIKELPQSIKGNKCYQNENISYAQTNTKGQFEVLSREGNNRYTRIFDSKGNVISENVKPAVTGEFKFLQGGKTCIELTDTSVVPKGTAIEVNGSGKGTVTVLENGIVEYKIPGAPSQKYRLTKIDNGVGTYEPVAPTPTTPRASTLDISLADSRFNYAKSQKTPFSERLLNAKPGESVELPAPPGSAKINKCTKISDTEIEINGTQYDYIDNKNGTYTLVKQVPIQQSQPLVVGKDLQLKIEMTNVNESFTVGNKKFTKVGQVETPVTETINGKQVQSKYLVDEIEVSETVNGVTTTNKFRYKTDSTVGNNGFEYENITPAPTPAPAAPKPGLFSPVVTAGNNVVTAVVNTCNTVKTTVGNIISGIGNVRTACNNLGTNVQALKAEVANAWNAGVNYFKGWFS